METLSFNEDTDVSFKNLVRRLLIKKSIKYKFGNFKVIEYNGIYPIEEIQNRISSIPILDPELTCTINVHGTTDLIIRTEDIVCSKNIILRNILIGKLKAYEHLYMTFSVIPAESERISSNYSVSYDEQNNIVIKIENPHFTSQHFAEIKKEIKQDINVWLNDTFL